LLDALVMVLIARSCCTAAQSSNHNGDNMS